MFSNLSDRLDKAFQNLKGQGQISEINIAATVKEIRRALDTLTPREADVVSSYFGLNAGHAMTLEEIGEKFDLTRERVRQIKEKAVRRLKQTSRSKILKTYLG